MGVAKAKRSAFDRLLSIFTQVRAGEGATAALMTANIFFIMTCYYILKPAREAFLSVEPRGAELASYAAAVMAVLFIPIVRIYGKYSERVGRRKLISVVTAVFIVNLFIFYFLAERQIPYFGFVFYVWLGIFNIMIVAQFWAYGNDIYRPRQGKRLFPLIQVGQSVGAITGPLVASWAVLQTGSASLMLVIAAGFLVLYILLTIVVDVREAPDRKTASREERQIARKGLGPEGGFELVWKHRYLLYLALLIMILNLVNTTGEFILRDAVFAAARNSTVGQGVFAANFYSRFFFWVNLVGLIVQAFLVSRVLKFVGVRGAIFILPLIGLFGYSLIALIPMLALIRVIKTAENAVDYSLMNTLRAALFLPTTREMKYKAKQAIDTFFVRAGDVISAGVVFLGIHLLGFGGKQFAFLTIGFVVIWLVLARAIAREHRKLLPEE